MFKSPATKRPVGRPKKNPDASSDAKKAKKEEPTWIGTTSVEFLTEQNIRRTLTTAHPVRVKSKAHFVAARDHAIELLDQSVHDFRLGLFHGRVYMYTREQKMSALQFLPKTLLRALLQERVTSRWTCKSGWYEIDVNNNLACALLHQAQLYGLDTPKLKSLVEKKKEWREGVRDALTNQRLTDAAALSKSKQLICIALTACYKIHYNAEDPTQPPEFQEQLTFDSFNSQYWGLHAEHPFARNLAGLAAETRRVACHNPGGEPHQYDRKQIAQRIANFGFMQESQITKNFLRLRDQELDAQGEPLANMDTIFKFDALLVNCKTLENAKLIAQRLTDMMPWISFSVDHMAWSHQQLVDFYNPAVWRSNYMKVKNLADRSVSYLLDWLARSHYARVGDGPEAGFLKLHVESGYAEKVKVDWNQVRLDMQSHAALVSGIDVPKRLQSHGGTVLSPWLDTRQLLSRALVYQDRNGVSIFGTQIFSQEDAPADLPLCLKRFDVDFTELGFDLGVANRPQDQPEEDRAVVRKALPEYLRRHCPTFLHGIAEPQKWTDQTVIAFLSLCYQLFAGRPARCLRRWLDFHGRSGTGKSSLVQFLTRTVAIEDSVENLHAGSQQTFALGNIDKRVAYAVMELTGSSRPGVGSFIETNPSITKQLVGDDRVSVVRKYQCAETADANVCLLTCGNAYASDSDAFSAGDIGPYLRRRVGFEFAHSVKEDPTFSARLAEESGAFFFASWACFCIFVSSDYKFGLEAEQENTSLDFHWEDLESDQMRQWNNLYRAYLSPLSAYLRDHAVYKIGVHTQLTKFLEALNVLRKSKRQSETTFSEEDAEQMLAGQNLNLVDKTECRACAHVWDKPEDACKCHAKNHKTVRFLADYEPNIKHASTQVLWAQ
jgi:hypothetical protein